MMKLSVVNEVMNKNRNHSIASMESVAGAYPVL